jgi:hypothetical protein
LTIKRVFISEQLSYYISIYSLKVLFFSQITDSLTEIRSKITRSKYIPYKNIVIKTNLNIFCQEKWALTIYAHKHYFFFCSTADRFLHIFIEPTKLRACLGTWSNPCSQKNEFFYVKINIFLVFFDYFDVLISKIIF